jgi:hypothetical protein
LAGALSRLALAQEISPVAGHRFEIGECVTCIEKRFPNGERHTELVVLERLAGAGEPRYRLRSLDGPALYVFSERQLSPRGSTAASRPPDAVDLAAPAPGWAVSPWAA